MVALFIECLSVVSGSFVVGGQIVDSSTLTFTSCLTLGMLFDLFLPQFFHT